MFCIIIAMSEIAEQARKNEAVYRDMAMFANRHRLIAGAELNAYDRKNGNSREPDVGISVGIRYQNGSADMGFVAPEDTRQNYFERARDYDNDARLYTKLADLSAKGHIVSEEQFRKYQEYYQPTGFFGKIFASVDDGSKRTDNKYLEEFTRFTEAGGNAYEFAKVMAYGGSEKEYLQNKKDGKAEEYINGLVKEAKEERAEQKAEDARAAREERQQQKEGETGARENPAKKKDDKLTSALEGLQKNGVEMRQDASAPGAPESRPMVAATQEQSRGSQIS